MENEATSTDQLGPSGLLISVEPVRTAMDRGKANGSVADNDGND